MVVVCGRQIYPAHLPRAYSGLHGSEKQWSWTTRGSPIRTSCDPDTDPDINPGGLCSEKAFVVPVTALLRWGSMCGLLLCGLLLCGFCCVVFAMRF